MMAALAVQWWDGAVASRVAASGAMPPPGVTVIGLRGQAERETARPAIRAALTDALAAQYGVTPDRVLLHSPSGDAPWATVELDTGPRRVALAISHDGELSVAAFSFADAVGIDVSQVVPVPDWEAVARDYLGPAAVQTLAALPFDTRDAAFARAWSEHEARLKSLGLQLEEWRAERASLLAACTCLPLALPAGYAGYLALAAAG
jgi:4'-phosphopantetheinyl transferase